MLESNLESKLESKLESNLESMFESVLMPSAAIKLEYQGVPGVNPPAIAVTMPVKTNVGANEADAVQAIVQTDRHNSEALRAEQLAHRITRAGAEQSKRLAECARESLTTLIRHLDQPCLSIDRNGNITHWNDSMARLSAIPANDAIGAPYTAMLSLAPPHPLHRLLASLTAATTYQSESWIAQILSGPIPLVRDIEVAQIKLIPLYHVPGTLAAVIVLGSL